MEWYYILLIVLASLIVVCALVFLILYLSGKSSKQKSLGEAKGVDAANAKIRLVDKPFISLFNSKFRMHDFKTFRKNTTPLIRVILLCISRHVRQHYRVRDVRVFFFELFKTAENHTVETSLVSYIKCVNAFLNKVFNRM